MLLHIDALRDDTKSLFLLISQKKRPYQLVGGTALALYLGHRESIDLDFVLYKSVTDDDMAMLKALSHDYQLLYRNDTQIDMMVGGVKMTIFSYYRNPLEPLQYYESIAIWSLIDIAVSKAYTIGRRSEVKDYIDLYTILSENHCTIEQIITDARRKYQGDFSAKLFLKQLLLVDRCENVEIVMRNNRTLDIPLMKQYFYDLVGSLCL